MRTVLMLPALVFILLPGAGLAGDEIRYAGGFNQVPLGCRAVGMGNAAVSLPIGSEGLFWNPALPAFEDRYHVWMEGARLYGGLSHTGAAAFTAPVQSKLSLSGAYAAYFSGNIIEHDSLQGTPLERLYDYSLRPDGNDGVGVFQNNHHMILASVGKLFAIPLPRPAGFSVPIPLDLGAGLTFRYYWQTMDPGDKVRMGVNANLDLGAAVRLGVDYDLDKQEITRALTFGVSVKNLLPTKMVWLHSPENYVEPIDRATHFGLSYSDRSGKLFGNWLVAIELHRLYETSFHAGIEGEFWNMVAFRAGVSDGVATLGAGIRYRDLTVDYSFSFDQLQYSPLRLAVGYRFNF